MARVEFPVDRRGETYRALTYLVAPRPIAWVSTRSPEGLDNLAPYAFYQLVSTDPPILMFSSMGEKDTVRNIRATGEFVVSGAPASLMQQINESAVEFPEGTSEFDAVGVTREPSRLVRAARVQEAPYALECTLEDIQQIGNGFVVFGQIVCIAVDEQALEDGKLSSQRLDLTARLGGPEWSRLGELVSLERMKLAEYEASRSASS